MIRSRRAGGRTSSTPPRALSRASPQNPPSPLAKGQAAGGRRGRQQGRSAPADPPTPAPGAQAQVAAQRGGIGLGETRVSAEDHRHQQGRAPGGQAERLDGMMSAITAPADSEARWWPRAAVARRSGWGRRRYRWRRHKHQAERRPPWSNRRGSAPTAGLRPADPRTASQRSAPPSYRRAARAMKLSELNVLRTRASRSSGEIEAVGVHHLGPGRHEVVHELLLGVGLA
jgi:hypothetical protein